MNNKIIPGILEHDWESIEIKLQQIKTFTNTAHIDIIDGKFVNNKTFLNPEPFKKYSPDIFLELHMMVENPINLLAEWAGAGFRRFLGHIEHMPSQADFVTEAKKYGEVGLALDGPTHISEIKVPFENLDAILIYTSNRVGFSGPPLMDDRLDKIRHLRKLTNIPIEADGGVSDKTIARAKEAGATRFISTSCIWNTQNPEEQYKNLNKIIS
jgi:ribulose-phosphate 3-epimerase